MILGVTGGIAAGKSRVAAFFRRFGAEVVSADELAREVVSPGSPVLERLVERFGSAILAEDGSLNRPALAALVFGDEGARRDLNRIIHPAIGRLARQRLGEAARRAAVVIYEAPLLFEAGAEERVDAVLTVTASDDVRLARLRSRDALTEEEARARLAAQMPQEEKAARSDFVVDNSGPWEETEIGLEEVWKRIAGGASGTPQE